MDYPWNFISRSCDFPKAHKFYFLLNKVFALEFLVVQPKVSKDLDMSLLAFYYKAEPHCG